MGNRGTTPDWDDEQARSDGGGRIALLERTARVLRARHLRNLADSRCRKKHPDYHQSLICVGPGSARSGPPCDACLEETRQEYETKLGKMHGKELSPEEAEAVKEKLGLP